MIAPTPHQGQGTPPPAIPHLTIHPCGWTQLSSSSKLVSAVSNRNSHVTAAPLCPRGPPPLPSKTPGEAPYSHHLPSSSRLIPVVSGRNSHVTAAPSGPNSAESSLRLPSSDRPAGTPTPQTPGQPTGQARPSSCRWCPVRTATSQQRPAARTALKA